MRQSRFDTPIGHPARQVLKDRAMGGHQVPGRGPGDDGYDEEGYDESQRAEILEATSDGPTNGSILTDITPDLGDDNDDDEDDLRMTDDEIGEEDDDAAPRVSDMREDEIQSDFEDDEIDEDDLDTETGDEEDDALEP